MCCYDVAYVDASAMLTFSSDDFDSMIRIKVGVGNTTAVFEMHKGVLRFYSGYFRVAVNNLEQGRFAESVDNMISLPEEDVEVFKAFKTWIYTKGLPGLLDDEKCVSELLSRLWCFGDRREIPAFQNECIKAIIAGMKSSNIVPTPWLEYIYEYTMPGSPLRRLIICAATEIDATDFAQHATRWTKESLLDLVLHLMSQNRASTWEEMEARICEWHIHEEGVTCKK